ncbi:hypothetical protein HNP84_008074 [Thermocatellispora tengchongensis]|uniref:DUF2029 domain-containing protein n=1 Tax=Thermocatellispora tengchongensis TaxID=1073253 RepID=A0A840PKI9_9ACTN|nr:hypothetical protein [Thermocatellispora tengchongensis]MBB5138321.1 hypothetical protein [Thermocatellispora tengchongensis]
MDYAILTGSVLVLGVVLAIVAQWRGWRPTLLVVLGVGIAFRVLIMYTSAIDSWQPVDYVNSFGKAAQAVVEGKDPVLESNGGWHFLPTIPYVYGLLLAVGIPWEYAGRLVTVVADIVLIPLVGKLAGGPKASLRAFQYACNPLGILVASVHGQVEPVALVFGVAAFVVARGPGDPVREGLSGTFRELLAQARQSVAAYGPVGSLKLAFAPRPGATRRGIYAGLLMGLALCAKSWPIWLIPGMLLLLPGARARLAAIVATGVPPLVFLASLPVLGFTPLDKLPDVIAEIRHIRPIIGEWGWTAWVVEGHWTLDAGLASLGTNMIYIAVLVVLFLWRRADPIDLTTAILLVFMVFTPRLGAQYLLWFMPFLVARPTFFAWPAILGTSLWAGIGYIVLTQWTAEEWAARHAPWAISSVVLLPILAAAMPWTRRRVHRDPAPVQAPEKPAASKGAIRHP